MASPSNKRPLVTMLLFCYNQERHIREVLESALAQDYEPLEIVVSDDCSTDRTFEIAREIVSSYNGPHKVVVHRNSYNCYSRAENHQTDGLVHGELRVYGDGDDIHLPNQVSALVSAWEAMDRKPSFLSSNYELIDEDGKHIGYGLPTRRKSFYDDGRDPLPFREIPGGGCSILCRYDDLMGPKSGFPDVNDPLLDCDLSLARRARLRGGVYYCNQVLLKYRLSNRNISQHRDKGRKEWINGEIDWCHRRLRLLDQYERDVRALGRDTPEMARRISAKRTAQLLNLDILQQSFVGGLWAIMKSFALSGREGLWSGVTWVRRWTGLLLKR